MHKNSVVSGIPTQEDKDADHYTTTKAIAISTFLSQSSHMGSIFGPGRLQPCDFFDFAI